MSTRAARTLIATVATSALALGSLVGCSSNGTTQAGSHPAQQNPLAALVADVTGSLRKAADSTDKVTSVGFTMTTTTSGVKASGSGAIAFQPLAMEVDLTTSATGATTIRVVNDTFYVKVPAAQRATLHGKTWLKMSPGKNSPFNSVNRQVQDINPVQQVKTLLASGKAVAVGQETIDGVPTVHYKVTTSVDTALSQVDPKDRNLVKGVYEHAGVTQITTEIWIDAQYRPHRAHVVTGSLSDTTIDYHNYNEPVKVDVPPASQTQDLDALLPGLGQ
ncbi:MAG: LppX_LprAFG lipoprotein [Micromonosporaceae bacterium]|nr:LppX_LprAFG lipoprotein [Micromonosporaceae bacterium]